MVRTGPRGPAGLTAVRSAVGRIPKLEPGCVPRGSRRRPRSPCAMSKLRQPGQTRQLKKGHIGHSTSLTSKAAAAGSTPGAAQQAEDPRHVRARLRVGRDAAVALHRPGARRCTPPAPAPPCRRSASGDRSSGAPARRSRRPGRTGRPARTRAAVPGMNWAMPAPRRALGERVEAGLGVQLRREQLHRHVPAQRRARDRVAEARRHERRQRATRPWSPPAAPRSRARTARGARGRAGSRRSRSAMASHA